MESTHDTVRNDFFVFENQLQNLNVHPTVVNDKDQWDFFFLLFNLYDDLLWMMQFNWLTVFRISNVFGVFEDFGILLILVFGVFEDFGILLILVTLTT